MLTFAKQTTSMIAPALSPEPTPSLVSPQSTEISSSECKKPRKNRSAYTLFALDVKPRIKASSNSKMSCVDLQTAISQLWKGLSAEERKKYQDQANEEKLHYMLKLKKFYENASPETLEEANKPKPKRPYSAYCYFVKEIRHVIKLPDAKFKMQEILKQASEKWRMLSEEEKAIYHEKARLARENYASEPMDPELEKIEESVESDEIVEEVKPAKKVQEKKSKASSTNKKRGIHFSKDIREKMEKLENQSPVTKKVKTDLFSETQSNLEVASAPKIQSTGLNLDSLLIRPTVLVQQEKAEVKEESMEQQMFKPLPIKVQPTQAWSGLSVPQLQMPSNVNLMRELSLAMGFEQARRQLLNHLMLRNIGQMTLQQNLPAFPEKNIEVKAESLCEIMCV